MPVRVRSSLISEKSTSSGTAQGKLGGVQFVNQRKWWVTQSTVNGILPSIPSKRENGTHHSINGLLLRYSRSDVGKHPAFRIFEERINADEETIRCFAV